METETFSPWDSRYYEESKPLLPYLSQEARLRHQARVELALVRAYVKLGVAPAAAAKELEAALSKLSPQRVAELEKATKHDVRALIEGLRELVPEKTKPWVHLGATSYDVVDTANAVAYNSAKEKVLVPLLIELAEVWADLATKYSDTVQIGRTHGQHAVPTTFGWTICWYLERLVSAIERLEATKIPGKFSGAVGTYAASGLIAEPAKLEALVMEDLGLKASAVSTQVAPPEPLIKFEEAVLEALGVLADFANTMRQLQRSEIDEVAQAFDAKHQVGSSTMPHKRNPWEFEHVVSLAVYSRPHLQSLFHLQTLEHQRDLTDSVVRRFYPLEDLLALHAAAARLVRISKELVVRPEAMKRNFDANADKIVAEPLQILLSKYGHPAGHEVARKLAISGKGKLLDLALAEQSLKPYFAKFSKAELNILKTPAEYTGLAAEKTKEVAADVRRRLKRLKK